MSYIEITVSVRRVSPEKGGRIEEVMVLRTVSAGRVVWVAVPGDDIAATDGEHLFALELRTNKDVELRPTEEGYNYVVHTRS